MTNNCAEINKRFTLNWLIQGAAQHAGITFHHVVRNELEAINPDLISLYDQYALINLLQYWHVGATLLLGSPTKYWKGGSRIGTTRFSAIPCCQSTEACSLTLPDSVLWNASRKRGFGRSDTFSPSKLHA